MGLHWPVRAFLTAAASLSLLSACSRGGGNSLPTAAVKVDPTPSSGLSVATNLPIPPASFSPSSTPTVASTQKPAFHVCSPLQDMTLAELPQIVVNPFTPPRPGEDDGHHGVDFAYYHRGAHQTMVGLGIYSVLAGRVASVIDDRPPYGNMIMVETPLKDLPSAFLSRLILPPSALAPTPSPRLSCPVLTPPAADGGQRSLYLLYAHMEKPSDLKVDDPIGCGQPLGSVGNTGFSGNPHLHFEVRVGPSGSTFEAMSHYNNRASQVEMSNYCLWRISGYYQLVDPLAVLAAGEAFEAGPQPAN
jgi:murein DD-endopeptidase MepM/ murein hydrolase activator NlpD